MSLIGVDKNETLTYVSVNDKGEPKTIFVIGVLTNAQRMAVIKDMVDASGNVDSAKMQELSPKIFVMGVRSILGLIIGDKPIDISPVTEESLEMIPAMVVPEVAAKVIEFNFFSRQEQKN